jgi:large conductance mechanosensitive channel
MSLLKEFKEFAVKGNVVDLAIAVVVGAAFGKVITSFVDNVLMPPVGVLIGHHDFSNYFLALTGTLHYATLAQARAAGAATLNYGLFANAVIDFLIVALAMFLVIRQMNRLTRKPAEVTTPTMRDCPQCLSPIPMAAKRCRFCAEPVPAAQPLGKL